MNFLFFFPPLVESAKLVISKCGVGESEGKGVLSSILSYMAEWNGAERFRGGVKIGAPTRNLRNWALNYLHCRMRHTSVAINDSHCVSGKAKSSSLIYVVESGHKTIINIKSKSVSWYIFNQLRPIFLCFNTIFKF